MQPAHRSHLTTVWRQYKMKIYGTAVRGWQGAMAAVAIAGLTACGSDRTTTGPDADFHPLLSVGTAAYGSGQTSAAGVVPVVSSGNVIDLVSPGADRVTRACIALTGDAASLGYKMEVPPLTSLASAPLPFGPVGIYGSDGTNFEWLANSNITVIKVIVKGGPQYATYGYGNSLGDSFLASPVNESGGPASISHVVMCYKNGPISGGGGGGIVI